MQPLRFIYLAKGVSRRSFLSRYKAFKPAISPALTEDVVVVVRDSRVRFEVQDTDSILCGVLCVNIDSFKIVRHVLRRMSQGASNLRRSPQEVMEECINEMKREING